jgi:hypothetical protein
MVVLVNIWWDGKCHIYAPIVVFYLNYTVMIVMKCMMFFSFSILYLESL